MTIHDRLRRLESELERQVVALDARRSIRLALTVAKMGEATCGGELARVAALERAMETGNAEGIDLRILPPGRSA